jgi:hypothetical protein
VDASSFTAGADYAIHAATITGFSAGSIDMSIDVVASDGTTRVEAEDEDRAFGSASNTGDTIVAVVDVDRKRGAPEWDLIAGIGEFTGSFIIKLEGKGPTADLRSD